MLCFVDIFGMDIQDMEVCLKLILYPNLSVGWNIKYLVVAYLSLKIDENASVFWKCCVVEFKCRLRCKLEYYGFICNRFMLKISCRTQVYSGYVISCGYLNGGLGMRWSIMYKVVASLYWKYYFTQKCIYLYIQLIFLILS